MNNIVEVQAYCLAKFQADYTTLTLDQKIEVNRQVLEERRIALDKGINIIYTIYRYIQEF